MSKEILIGTLHYGFNEGAIAQAHCLSQIIEQEIPNSRSAIIDKRYPDKVAVYGKPENGRTKAIQDAIDNWLPVTKEKFFDSNNQQCLKYIDSNSDAMIVGSDQIWDLKYKRRFRRLLSKGIFPSQTYGFYPAFPNIYWPNQYLTIPKFSYAASVGHLDFNSIPKSHLKQMSKILNEFELISVRDDRTLNFLELIDTKLAENARMVPDPTLAYNMVTQDHDLKLKSKLASLGFDFDRQRVGFIASDFGEAHLLCERLRKQNIQTICITTNNNFCDLNLSNEAFHPLEWVRIFNFLDVCMTDRMHAMIFCLRNETPFIAIDNWAAYESNTKIVSLLSKLNLMNCYQPTEHIIADESYSMIRSLLDKKWDWETLNKKLKLYGEVGLEYMREIGSKI